MKKLFLTVALTLVCLSSSRADEKRPILGRQVTDFRSNDYRGKEHRLDDFADSKLMVVAFLGTECPLVKLYGPRLTELDAKYAEGDVAFVGINSNVQDSLTEIASYARRHKIDFPILKDLGNKLADQLGAERTPEVFLLDKNRVVRYHGRIDDQYGVGYIRDEVTSPDLKNAIDELLAGKEVTKAATKFEGCIIGRVREVASDATVTYTKHIAPILNEQCVQCHRPGEIAPFSLTEYNEVAGWAEMIDEVIDEGRMPPWHADPKHGKFSNERRLSSAEKKLIHDWVRAGAPQGDPNDKPALPKAIEGWQLPREPDLVIHMQEEPYSVPAKGTVRYKYFAVDPKLTEDKWITSAELQPGNRAVVHHILVFAMPKSGSGRRRQDGLSGGFLVAYVPGLRARVFPTGMAKKIPAGSRLVFQVHYTPIGTPQEDRSKLGLVFADSKDVTHEVRTKGAFNRWLAIPPKEGSHPVEAKSPTFREEFTLLALMPHMHLRGKSFRYEAEFADGKTEVLLDVPHYDFNWQTAYQLATPRTLPPGTKLRCYAQFDNSEHNLNNPDPSKLVRWGDQTWEEMMIGYYDYAVARDGKPEPKAEVKIPADGYPIPKQYQKAFNIFDTDNDNRLTKAEIDAMPLRIRERVLQYIELNP